MADLIDRQAEIDAVWSLIKKTQPLATILNLLSGLPSAEPERKTERWIPCSERLPEKHQMVLTTIKGGDLIIRAGAETLDEAIERTMRHVRVSVGFIDSDGWYGADGYPMIVDPIAWMPLPEGYRGDEDD